jgi:hypothetical protein
LSFGRLAFHPCPCQICGSNMKPEPAEPAQPSQPAQPAPEEVCSHLFPNV